MTLETKHSCDVPEQITARTGAIRSWRCLNMSTWKEVLHLCADEGEFILKRTELKGAWKLRHESLALGLLRGNTAVIVPSCVLEATILGSKCYLLTTYIPGNSFARISQPPGKTAGLTWRQRPPVSSSECMVCLLRPLSGRRRSTTYSESQRPT